MSTLYTITVGIVRDIKKIFSSINVYFYTYSNKKKKKNHFIKCQEIVLFISHKSLRK